MIEPAHAVVFRQLPVERRHDRHDVRNRLARCPLPSSMIIRCPIRREPTWLSFFGAPRGTANRFPDGARACRGRRDRSQSRRHTGGGIGRRIQYVAGQDPLGIEQPVDQRLIGLVARLEHVVLEPFLGVCEAPSEIDVDIGRVHHRRGVRRQATAWRPWRTTVERFLRRTACASSCRDARADRPGCRRGRRVLAHRQTRWRAPSAP